MISAFDSNEDRIQVAATFALPRILSLSVNLATLRKHSRVIIWLAGDKSIQLNFARNLNAIASDLGMFDAASSKLRSLLPDLAEKDALNK